MRTNRLVIGALTAVMTAGFAGTAAAAPTSGTVGGERAVVTDSNSPKALVKNSTCSGAPEGALVIDYADEDSICWVGSGRTDNPDTKPANQVHTAANRGFITVADGSGVHDIQFGPNQTLNLANGTTIRVIAMNE
jgi:hypothetical protein